MVAVPAGYHDLAFETPAVRHFGDGPGPTVFGCR